MKKYCLIILLIIFSKSIFSQTDYYWYKNKRIYLEKNLHKRFIVFENISDSNELKQIINIPDLQIKSINKEKKICNNLFQTAKFGYFDFNKKIRNSL